MVVEGRVDAARSAASAGRGGDRLVGDLRVGLERRLRRRRDRRGRGRAGLREPGVEPLEIGSRPRRPTPGSVAVSIQIRVG